MDLEILRWAPPPSCLPSRLPTISPVARRPMTVVFGLGTRLCLHMRTKLENGVLHNVKQPSSAVNSFIDQGEFEATKTLRVVELRAVISRHQSRVYQITSCTNALLQRFQPPVLSRRRVKINCTARMFSSFRSLCHR